MIKKLTGNGIANYLRNKGYLFICANIQIASEKIFKAEIECLYEKDLECMFVNV